MKHPDFRSPVLLFRLLIGLIAGFAVISPSMAFYTTAVVDSASRQSTSKSDTAMLAGEASEKLSELDKVLEERAHTYRESNEAMALPPEKQAALAAEPERLDDGLPNPELTGISIPLSMSEAARFQGLLEYLEAG